MIKNNHRTNPRSYRVYKSSPTSRLTQPGHGYPYIGAACASDLVWGLPCWQFFVHLIFWRETKIRARRPQKSANFTVVIRYMDPDWY